MVGDRGQGVAEQFIADLASRLANPVQITTDGHGPYLPAIEAAFGIDVDYAMLIKEYGQDPNEEWRFSPPVVLSETSQGHQGLPRPRQDQHELPGAVEPDDAHGNAAVHSADQRLLQRRWRT